MGRLALAEPTSANRTELLIPPARASEQDYLLDRADDECRWTPEPTKADFQWVQTWMPCSIITEARGNRSEQELWKWLALAQKRRDPDETGLQFYDTYWGWWNEVDACPSENGAWLRCHPLQSDLPTVIYYDGDFSIWDGHHRLTIALLARIPFVPIMLGYQP